MATQGDEGGLLLSKLPAGMEGLAGRFAGAPAHGPVRALLGRRDRRS